MSECAVCGTPLGPVTGRGRRPMTCSPACRLRRKNAQSQQSRERAARRGCPKDKHGTSTGAFHYKCHCTKCAKWVREYKRQQRAGYRAVARH